MADNPKFDGIASAALFNHLATAANAVFERHASSPLELVAAMNQFYASIVGGFVKEHTDDPDYMIDKLLEGLRERMADIVDGTEPSAVEFLDQIEEDRARLQRGESDDVS